VEQILQAAARVFEERGYARGTTNHIARRAGVSVGTLYQYFRDKDAILVALALGHMEEGAALLEALLDAQPADPGDLDAFLERVVRAMLALHTHAPRLHQVLFDEAPWPATLRESLLELNAAMAERVARTLVATPGLDLPHPHTSAWLLVQLVESLTHQLVIHPPPGIDEEEVVGEVVRLLGGYLRSTADQPKPSSRPPW
jgi:AcrR family transcriptional regulator